MDYERFAEEAFSGYPKLRYVGIVDASYRVLLSKMREGVQSVTLNESDRNFVQLMPPIILDGVEKLQPLLGKVDKVTVRYEKVILMFFRAGENVVIMSFDPDITTPFISSLSDFMNTLTTKYLA